MIVTGRHLHGVSVRVLLHPISVRGVHFKLVQLDEHQPCAESEVGSNYESELVVEQLFAWQLHARVLRCVPVIHRLHLQVENNADLASLCAKLDVHISVGEIKTKGLVVTQFIFEERHCGSNATRSELFLDMEQIVPVLPVESELSNVCF